MRLQALLEDNSLRKRALKFQQLVLEHVHDADVKLSRETDEEGEYIVLTIKHAFLDCKVFIQPDEVAMEHNGTESYLGTSDDIEDAFNDFYPDAMADSLRSALSNVRDVTDTNAFLEREDKILTLEVCYQGAQTEKSLHMKWNEATQCFVDEDGDELSDVADVIKHIESKISRRGRG